MQESTTHHEPAAQTRGPGSSVASTVSSTIAASLLRAAGNPAIALQLPDGERVCTHQGAPVATFALADHGTLLRLIAAPQSQFAELYVEGRVSLVGGDLVAGLREAFLAQPPAARGTLGDWFRRHLAGVRRNGLARARRQAQAHYDLGNGFYSRWLDRTLSYTCAYFTSPNATLLEAQVAKLDHVCRKAGLREGAEVIELGSGWGSLALHAASRYGARVRAYNVSGEQLASARARVRAAGLEGRVEFIEADWREATGRCDALLSVGMLEHVGPGHYAELGQLARRLLRPDGIGVIHTIGRVVPEPVDGWIQRHVFPGTYVPSPGELMGVFEPAGLAVFDLENLRPHYARTLALWLANYRRVRDEVAAAEGTRFARLWELYLAGSCAAFEAGRMQLYQVVFGDPVSPRMPWTREHLYRADPRTWQWTAATS